MTREEASALIGFRLKVPPHSEYVNEWLELFVALHMLKLDEDIPPEKTAMCKAFSNYENTYRHREARSGMPEREACLILKELEKLGFKVVKA